MKPPHTTSKTARRKTITVFVISTLAISLLAAGLAYMIISRGAPKSDANQPAAISSTPDSGLRYHIADLSKEETARVEDILRQIDPNAVNAADNANITIAAASATASESASLIFSLSPTPTGNFSDNGQLLQDSTPIAVRFASENLDLQTKVKETFSQTYRLGGENWTYLALGDIIPARDVYTHSKRQGYEYPYQKIAERSKAYDLTVSNLETTVADGQNYGEGASMMTFTAPAKALDGLLAAGVDGVSLANNHAMNGGASKVGQMLSDLEARGIGHFGVSPKSNQPNIWTTTVKETAVTHLSFNTVPGSIEPTATTPGLKRIDLQPWGKLSVANIDHVKTEVANAKKSTDVVITWFHWGQEYTHAAGDEQRQLAHAAIDVGADVVIATHPHWTQGVEWYNGHLIAYSLGNFVFDQNWSEETKRSTALALNFSGKTLVGAELLPARIENYVQPRWLLPTEITYRQILADIKTHSWWP